MKGYSIRILRIPVFVLVSAIMFFSLTGCQNESSIKLEQFSTSDKSFGFPGLEWGWDPSQTEKALGCEITSDGNPGPDENGDTHISMYGDPVVLDGTKGETVFQFVNDHLWAAGINFMYNDEENGPEKGEEDYKKMLSSAEECFGEPTEVIESQPDSEELAGISAYQSMWEREDEDGVTTRVVIGATYRDGEFEFFVVNVSQFPILESY